MKSGTAVRPPFARSTSFSFPFLRNAFRNGALNKPDACVRCTPARARRACRGGPPPARCRARADRCQRGNGMVAWRRRMAAHMSLAHIPLYCGGKGKSRGSEGEGERHLRFTLWPPTLRFERLIFAMYFSSLSFVAINIAEVSSLTICA